jgi:hypothetical protein
VSHWRGFIPTRPGFPEGGERIFTAPERDDDAGAQADYDCNQVLPRWQTIVSPGRLCGIAAPQFLRHCCSNLKRA